MPKKNVKDNDSISGLLKEMGSDEDKPYQEGELREDELESSVVENAEDKDD
jgi:hypothetical protein